MKSEWQDKIVTYEARPGEDAADAIKHVKAAGAKALTAAHAGEAQVYSFRCKPMDDGGMEYALHMKYCTDTKPADWIDGALPAVETVETGPAVG